MDQRRLTTWLETASVLPEAGRIGVFNAWPEIELPGIDPERIRAVQPMAHLHAALTARGIKTATYPNYRYDAVILLVPREKSRALSYLKDALRRTPDGAPVIVDGQKTDGIESLLKLCRARFDVREVVSKAHGKLFWIKKRETEDVMNALDMPEPGPELQPFGFHTAAGVFSADCPDAGSVHLAELLPVLKGRVADLGAGWGYLSQRILERGGPDEMHLVEADWLALECARKNVTSEAARFHWADARGWKPEALLDTVVMNPPFHTGRKAEPELGRAFIRAAAGLLTPKGSLWLVANRHLPYEKALAEAFREVRELGDTPAFKVFHAERPAAGRGRTDQP